MLNLHKRPRRLGEGTRLPFDRFPFRTQHWEWLTPVYAFIGLTLDRTALGERERERERCRWREKEHPLRVGMFPYWTVESAGWWFLLVQMRGNSRTNCSEASWDASLLSLSPKCLCLEVKLTGLCCDLSQWRNESSCRPRRMQIARTDFDHGPMDTGNNHDISLKKWVTYWIVSNGWQNRHTLFHGQWISR